LLVYKKNSQLKNKNKNDSQKDARNQFVRCSNSFHRTEASNTNMQSSRQSRKGPLSNHVNGWRLLVELFAP
jgi:hypothetical protein